MPLQTSRLARVRGVYLFPVDANRPNSSLSRLRQPRLPQQVGIGAFSLILEASGGSLREESGSDSLMNPSSNGTRDGLQTGPCATDMP